MYQAHQVGKILYGFPCHNNLSNQGRLSIDHPLGTKVQVLRLGTKWVHSPVQSNSAPLLPTVIMHHGGNRQGDRTHTRKKCTRGQRLTEVQRGPARIHPRRDTASNNLSLHNMFIVDEEGETFGLRKYSLTHLQTKSVRWYLCACRTTARLLADTPVCATTIRFQVQPAQFSSSPS